MNHYVIGEIKKDSCSALRVTLVEAYEKYFVDLRQFIKNPKGDWIPTDKGVRLGSRLNDVLELIEKAKIRQQEIQQGKDNLLAGKQEKAGGE